jgi:hypothetical protein
VPSGYLRTPGLGTSPAGTERCSVEIAQVTDNIVHLSNLTDAEYFDAFVDVKDISAVVVRVAGR